MAQEKKGLGDMMKGKKGIWILGAFLVFLAGTYLILKNRNIKLEEEKQQAEEEARVPVTEGLTLQKISYTDGAESMSYVKEGEDWLYEPEREIVLDQDVMATMADVFSNLTAQRELKDGDELEDYGLAEPAYTLNLTEEDGTETVIYVGNALDDGRYVTMGDKSRIFTMDNELTSQLYFSLDNVAEQETFSISAGSSNLQQVTVSGPQGEKVYVNDQEITDTEDDSSQEDGDTEEDSSNEARPIDTLIGGLGAITFNSCADYHATEEELPAYGLDEASRITVTVTYTQDEETQTAVFYVGAQTEDGQNRYLQLEGSSMVHLATDASVENVINPEGT